jgi:hypothetical protein
VDIHNHWLRQEVLFGSIQIEYAASRNMMADGLTKALPIGKRSGFVDQLGLMDMKEMLELRKRDLAQLELDTQGVD